MDKLSLTILSSNPQDAGNGRLGILARTASKRYVEDGVKLSDAISQIARDEGLSHAQVRRVCEEANVATFRSLFEKQANKNVSFPLADFREVMGKEASRSERRTHIPTSLVGGFVPGSDSTPDLVEALFSKTAASLPGLGGPAEGPSPEGGPPPGPPEAGGPGPIPFADPMGGLVRLRMKLQGIQDQQRERADTLDSLAKAAEVEMLSAGVQHVLQGGSIGEVITALAPFAAGAPPSGPAGPGEPSPLGEAATKLADALVSKGIPRKDLVASMEKRSSSRTNPDHPMVQSFVAWSDANRQAKIARAAIQVADEHLDRVDGALGVR